MAELHKKYQAGCTERTTPEHLHPHPALPMRLLSYRDWARDVAACLRDEVKGRRDDFADRVRTRADAFELCVSGVDIEICASCGSPRPASGRLTSDGKPCQARTCPHCARRAAKDAGDWARKAVDEIDSAESPRGHRWRHIVLTTRYDPGDPDDVTVDALRDRVAGLGRAFSEAWKRGLKKHGAAAWKSFECAGTGNVHLHVLYRGGFVNQDWLAEQVHRGYPAGSRAMLPDELRVGARALVELGEKRRPWAVGRVVQLDDQRAGVLVLVKRKVKSQRKGEARKVWKSFPVVVIKPRASVLYPPINYVEECEGRDKVVEVVKYSLKSPGGRAEMWFSGEKRWCVNPRLVARWELAIFDRRISERYGAFRDVEKPDDQVEREERADTCVECGLSDFYVETWPLMAGIRFCHQHNVIALSGNIDKENVGLRAGPKRKVLSDGDEKEDHRATAGGDGRAGGQDAGTRAQDAAHGDGERRAWQGAQVSLFPEAPGQSRY